MQFPLLGLARDFHPLDNAHAEHTKSLATSPKGKLSGNFNDCWAQDKG
jgi:hypothetical protein